MNGPEAWVDQEGSPLTPRANSRLIGQQAAERTLRSAFEGGAMAHSWLISGPKGIGKATLCFRMARFALNSGASAGGLFGDAAADTASAGGGLWSDPNTPAFKRIAAGGHADLLTVQRSLNDSGKLRNEIVVDDVRKIGGFLRLTAGEGGWRVVIVDSADEMNRNAANAVLKVLEEPPTRALLLLVSHNPGRLLPTIRSRCSRLSLPPLPEATVAELLAKYESGLEPDDAATIARLSEGSIGAALSLAEAGGLDLYRNVTDLLADLPRLNTAKLHEFSDKLGRSGAEPTYRTAMAQVTGWLARIITFSAKPEVAQGLPENERQILAQVSAAAGLERWLEVWENTNTLMERADAVNLDRAQVVLSVFLSIERAVRA